LGTMLAVQAAGIGGLGSRNAAIRAA